MKKVFFDLPKAFVLFTLVFVFLAQMFETFGGSATTFSMFALIGFYVGGSLSFSSTITTKRVGYALYAFGLLQVSVEAFNSAGPLAYTFSFVALLVGLFSLAVMLIVEIAKYFEVNISFGKKKKANKE